MKSCIWLLVTIGLLAVINQACAQSSQFFRISGPAQTTIVAFNADGTLVWSNAQPGATYTVQTATSLVGESNWVDYVQFPITNAVNTNLIISFNPPAGMTLIPAGSFTIGNSVGDLDITDAIPTNVYVSGFFMDKSPVSNGQWEPIYEYATNHGYNLFTGSGLFLTNYPVQSFQWDWCVKWCNARSQVEGLNPVYYADESLTQVYTNQPSDGSTIYANWDANGYRLPTEAEWEKAARGGLSGLRFPWGNTISESQANYNAYPSPPNSDGFSYDLGPYTGYNTNFLPYFEFGSPPGYFAPNGYGLNDMAGNVEQFCWDSYAGPPYPPGSPYLGGADPRVAASVIYSYAVLRGGSWSSDPSIARCAARFHNVGKKEATESSGFRCVRRL